jgi:hypothetical protein
MLKTVIALATTLLLNNIVRNIRSNYSMTEGLSPKKRRKLLWQYGPFMMHKSMINQMQKNESRHGCGS